MNKFPWHTFKRWLLKTIELQLFITFISLPILIGWGLPISLLSLIGNIIFTPVLVAILFLSSLIVACELCYVSSDIFIYPLEWLTFFWQSAMSTVDKTWLVACKSPSNTALIIALLCIIFLVPYSMRFSSLKRIILYTTLLMLCFVTNKFLTASYSIEYIPCHLGNLIIITTPTTTNLIDPGVLGRRISAPTFVEYTLAPALLKKTGRTTLDNVIITKPGVCTFSAITTLLVTIPVKNLYLPWWEGRLNISERKQWAALKKTAQEQGCCIHEVKGDIMRKLEDENYISIAVHESWKKWGQARYHTLEIMGQIDNNEFTFYSPLKE